MLLLERVEIWGLPGWLQSLKVAMDAEVRGREDNLCSRECIIVWTDEVTD